MQFDCKKCSFKCKNEPSLRTHVDNSHAEKQFNCDQCDFQATTQMQLNKHINLKHKAKGQTWEMTYQCKHCGEQFSEKWNLMMHRKIQQRRKIRKCTTFIENKCKFESKACWHVHDEEEMEIDEKTENDINDVDSGENESVFQKAK